MTGHVAVVGSGIAGLAAAWQLKRDGVSFEVLEADSRPGGKIKASEVNGCIVDEGADAFLARVPHAVELCRELGLADLLVAPAAGHAEIWTGDNLRPLPQPNVLGIPLEVDAVEALLGVHAAAAVEADRSRVVADPVRPDDTIGSVVRRRLGDDIHQNLVDPLLGAINAGDTDSLSLHASSPQILAAASAHPSLIRGLQTMTARRDPDAPVFHSFVGGVGVLIDALIDQLGDNIACDSPVTSIARTPDGLVVHHGDDRATSADAVILACPAARAAQMVVGGWPDASERLAAIPMVSVTLVTLAYAPGAIDTGAGLSGFVVPRSGSLRITACSYASTKWPHLAGDDERIVLRVSVGHSLDQVTPALDDDQLVSVIRDDLATAAGITSVPTATRVSRWPGAFPQYTIGHLDRLAQLEGDLNPAGVFVAGMSYRGIGIPACIDQGRSAAVDAVLHLLGAR